MRLNDNEGWGYVEDRLGVRPVLNGKNEFPVVGRYGFPLFKSFQVPYEMDMMERYGIKGCLCGITGLDAYEDYRLGNQGTRLKVVERLPFGYSTLVYFTRIGADDGRIRRVVAYYPNLARQYLEDKRIDFDELTWEPGKTEAIVRARTADGGIDVMENGDTIRETGLAVQAEIMLSQAVLISRGENKYKVRDIFGS